MIFGVWVGGQGEVFLISGCAGSSSLCTGFSRCRAWAPGCTGFSTGTWAQQLRLAGLVASRHVESSQTRDRTRVPCIGRQTLNHGTTKEIPGWGF